MNALLESLQAKYAIRAGTRERAWTILDWTIRHDPTGGFRAWPEGMSTKDLSLAEGDMPHGWVCAAYISLVRNMLVRESGPPPLAKGGLGGSKRKLTGVIEMIQRRQELFVRKIARASEDDENARIDHALPLKPFSERVDVHPES